MKIAIASDHAGYALKTLVIEHLKTKGLTEVHDFGPEDDKNSVDYPDYAKKVAKEVLSDQDYLGILICGTGIGMCITANKFKGIRAAHVGDPYSSEMARRHNNANIICLGGRVVGAGLAFKIIDAWMDAEYEGGRHEKRLAKIEG
ncbi:MAG: ribose 5-phosphate isomerase B [Pseudomonadota bacterium]